MANYKIIETNHNLPDVLIYRNVDDDGNNVVIIHASGYQNQDFEEIFTDVIIAPSQETAKCFIDDYSVASAVKWCEGQSLSYHPPGQ